MHSRWWFVVRALGAFATLLFAEEAALAQLRPPENGDVQSPFDPRAPTPPGPTSPPVRAPPAQAPPAQAPPVQAPPAQAPPAQAPPAQAPPPPESPPPESPPPESLPPAAHSPSAPPPAVLAPTPNPPTRSPLLTQVQGLQETLEQLGCKLHDVRRRGESWYIACGSAGLFVFAPLSSTKELGSSVVIEGRPFHFSKRSYPGAEVVGLREVGGDLSAQIRLSGLAPTAAGSPREAIEAFRPRGDGSRAKSSTTGQVIAVDDLLVQVSVGRRDALKMHDRVAFGETGGVVGRVVELRDTSSWVRVGMGEELPQLGDKASKTQRASTRKLAFLQNSDYRVALLVGGQFAATSQPNALMGVGQFEGLVQFDALRMGVRAGPVGGGGGFFVYQITGHIGVQHDVGAFELAFGSMRINANADVPIGRGIAFGPAVRIGTEDGLHFSSRLLLAIAYRDPVIGEVRGQIQVPLFQGLWARARASGGKGGLGSMDLGLRFLVDGTGGARSSFFHLFGGWMSLFQAEHGAPGTPRRTQTSGPSLGGTWEVRL